jgi:hypothetical protein
VVRSDDDAQLARELAEMVHSWAFRTASYVFHRNCEECLDYLWKIEHREPEEIIALAGDQKRQEEVGQEVIRLLTNAVGAAVALRNAVNGTYRHLHRDGSFPEFVAERRTRYDTHPIIQFVIRLRDYLIHVRPIAITFTFHMPDPQDASEWRVEIGFDLDALVQDSKTWRRNASTSAAKRYLRDLTSRRADDSPTLFKHLLQFRVLVEDFYRWFGRRETELQRRRLGRQVDDSEALT